MGKGEGRSELWKALQLLSNKRGVYRDDLINQLEGKLAPLREGLNIDLGQGLVAVRKTIEKFLLDSLPKLKVRPANRDLSVEDGARQYKAVVRVSFNLDPQAPCFQQDLTRRREWLAEDARGKFKIDSQKAQDDLNHAITQLEQLIPAGDYGPQSRTLISDEVSLERHAPETVEAVPTAQPEPRTVQVVPDQPEALELPPPPSPANRKRVAVIAAVAALALVGVGIGVWRAADKPGNPAASSTGNPSSGSQSTNGPSASNVSSENFTPGTALQLTNSKLTDGVSGWSVVFPSHSAAAPFNPQSYAKLGDDTAFYTKELKAGAYGFRGFGVNVTTNDVGPEAVTISNVRVVDRKVSAPLAGDIKVLPNQGAPTDQIVFNLDAAIDPKR